MKTLTAFLSITLLLQGQSIQVRGAGQARGAQQRRAAAATGVPADFVSLFTQHQGWLTAWNNDMQAAWQAAGGTVYTPLVKGVELVPASAFTQITAAPNISDPNDFYYTRIKPYITAACGATLGAKVVKWLVGFPMLYTPYYTYDDGAGHTGPGIGVYNGRLATYQQAVADAHALGCKVIIQSQVQGAQGASINDPALQFYYDSLTLQEYFDGRAANALAVMQLLQPDWTIYSSEPDNEGEKSGRTELQPAANPSGWIANIETMVTQIRDTIEEAGISGLHTQYKTGAGCGPWATSWSTLYPFYATLANSDVMEIHIHPLNAYPGGYLTRISTMCDAAIATGKACGFDESWIDKSTVAEQGTSVPTTIDARSLFSFWAPNDILFGQGLIALANLKQSPYISFSIPNTFFAVQTYDSVAHACLKPGTSCTTDQVNTAVSAVNTAENTAVFANINGPLTLTATGAAFKVLFQ